MDFSSPIGMILCLGIIIYGIIFLGGDIGNFVNLPSIMLTVIPTFCALIIAFPFNKLSKVFRHGGILLGRQKFDPIYYINLITSMAETARASGLIALESQGQQLDDVFVKSVVQMVSDGATPDIIESRMNGTLASLTDRHAESWAIYDKGAAFAPAFGMVATLVSLVNMLMNLNFADAGGVSSLGLNMSAALITTFYGSLMANVFFMPLSNKLKGLHQSEIFCKTLVMDGFIAIAKGVSPRDIKDMLTERLDPKQIRQMS